MTALERDLSYATREVESASLSVGVSVHLFQHEVRSLEKKLANQGFLAKAPAAVVEKERASLAALQAQLAGVQQSLAELT